MSRFEELATLARTEGERFKEIQREVQTFAQRLVVGFRRYLGEDVGMGVFCCDVDQGRRMFDGEFPFPNQLCLYSDGYFYFVLGIKLAVRDKHSDQKHSDDIVVVGAEFRRHFLVGINKNDAGFSIRLRDQDFPVTENTLEKDFYEPFFEKIRASLTVKELGQSNLI